MASMLVLRQSHSHWHQSTAALGYRAWPWTRGAARPRASPRAPPPDRRADRLLDRDRVLHPTSRHPRAKRWIICSRSWRAGLGPREPGIALGPVRRRRTSASPDDNPSGPLPSAANTSLKGRRVSRSSASLPGRSIVSVTLRGCCQALKGARAPYVGAKWSASWNLGASSKPERAKRSNQSMASSATWSRAPSSSNR